RPGPCGGECGRCAQRGARAVTPPRSSDDPGRSTRMTRFDRSMAWLARARHVVPGAAQTLSKGPSMFVEGAYPAFLERGRGCRVWDVDGNEYVDYLLGLASITLGYAYPPVVEAAARQLGPGRI